MSSYLLIWQSSISALIKCETNVKHLACTREKDTYTYCARFRVERETERMHTSIYLVHVIIQYCHSIEEEQNNNNIHTARIVRCPCPTVRWWAVLFIERRRWSIASSMTCLMLAWGWLSHLLQRRSLDWLVSSSWRYSIRSDNAETMNRMSWIIHRTKANDQMSNSVGYCSRNLSFSSKMKVVHAISLVSRHCLNKSNWWLSSGSSNLSANK